MTRRVESYETPFGAGRLVLEDDLPLELDLPAPGRPASDQGGGKRSDWSGLLARYFAGERVAFPLDLERFLDAHGFSAFERDVLRALSRVPYGRVVSYGELAGAAGHPNAYRAAGTVMAKNPLAVILPCHRVVRGDSTLGHYGDDPSWKPRLLRLEGVDVARLARSRPRSSAATTTVRGA